MPYEVVEERCEMADGSVGGFMIYKIEGEERVPFACHATSENAYGVISRIEAEEAKIMDEIKQFEEGQLIHWITEDDEGFGRIEALGEDMHTVRVYAQAGEEFEPTDRVMEVPVSGIHDYMEYAMGEFDDQVDDIMTDVEDELESESEPEQMAEEIDEEEDNMKADPAELSVGDFVSWESGEGVAQGKIEEIHTEGELSVPDSDFTLEASEEEPAYLIEVYERVEGGWRPSGVMVGHKADTLSKIEPLEIAEMKRRIIGRMKSIKAEMEETEDMKIGRIEGMASVYGNTDLGGDVVEKGAFKQTLNHSKIVPLLLDHNYSTAGIAGVAELEDGEKGLMLKAEMPLDVPEVMAAYKKIKFMIERGAKMGLSIGYDPVKTEPGVDGTRKLKELALHEVSITPFPMNTEAQIMAAKQAKRVASKPIKQNVEIEIEPEETDAPDGNQPAEQDARMALVEQIEKVFKQALEDIKTQLTTGDNNV
jgi:hypothetical protein